MLQQIRPGDLKQARLTFTLQHRTWNFDVAYAWLSLYITDHALSPSGLSN